MLSRMASQWKTFQQILRNTEHLVFNEAPRFIRHLQNPATVQRVIQQGILMGLEALVAGALAGALLASGVMAGAAFAAPSLGEPSLSPDGAEIAFVSGGSKGIGRATARLLAGTPGRSAARGFGRAREETLIGEIRRQGGEFLHLSISRKMQSLKFAR